jgi:hypothetical protein
LGQQAENEEREGEGKDYFSFFQIGFPNSFSNDF